MSASTSTGPTCPRIRHLVSGTFNTPFLHVFAYDTLSKQLSLAQSIQAQGPHQFLALGRTAGFSNQGLEGARTGRGFGDVLYATTWADPPSLSAWRIVGLDVDKVGRRLDDARGVTLEWINTVEITATSSYVHVQPPPYDSLTSPSYGVPPSASRYLFSAGGPTGEMHYLDDRTGAIGSKAQEIVFLQDSSPAALERADKTRKALRYGAHSFDFGKGEVAYVADLGRNAILSYRMTREGKGEEGVRMQLIGETKSPREGDGPRHVVPSPCGRWVFSVTEHTSFVDVYEASPSSSTSPSAPEQEGKQRLKHIQSLDILPAGADRGQYRGDTVRLSPDGKAVLATTRGKTSATKGIVRAWRIVSAEEDMGKGVEGGRGKRVVQEEPLCTFETDTSGGKANAIEFAARYGDHQFAQGGPEQGQRQAQTKMQGMDLAVLTDDERGYIWILEWDGQDLRQVAQTKLPGKASGGVGEGEEEGASHAVWIS